MTQITKHKHKYHYQHGGRLYQIIDTVLRETDEVFSVCITSTRTTNHSTMHKHINRNIKDTYKGLQYKLQKSFRQCVDYNLHFKDGGQYHNKEVLGTITLKQNDCVININNWCKHHNITIIDNYHTIKCLIDDLLAGKWYINSHFNSEMKGCNGRRKALNQQCNLLATRLLKREALQTK